MHEYHEIPKPQTAETLDIQRPTFRRAIGTDKIPTRNFRAHAQVVEVLAPAVINLCLRGKFKFRRETPRPLSAEVKEEIYAVSLLARRLKDIGRLVLGNHLRKVPEPPRGKIGFLNFVPETLPRAETEESLSVQPPEGGRAAGQPRDGTGREF